MTGYTGTLTRPAALADTPWGTSTASPSEWTVTLLGADKAEMWKDRATIMEGDRIVMMDAVSSPAPVVGDQMVIGSTTYRVLSVETLDLAGVALFYMLGLSV